MKLRRKQRRPRVESTVDQIRNVNRNGRYVPPTHGAFCSGVLCCSGSKDGMQNKVDNERRRAAADREEENRKFLARPPAPFKWTVEPLK